MTDTQQTFEDKVRTCSVNKVDDSDQSRVRKVNPGVGMPAYMKLDAFARELRHIFPECTGVFLVGSALYSKQWRDIDIRVMLPDAEYEREFGPYPEHQPQYSSPRWNALCCALSCWGSEMTGLPIDCQIQDTTRANDENPKVRSALGSGERLER